MNRLRIWTRTATASAPRGLLFGSLFVPVIGIVSSIVCSVPHASSLGDAITGSISVGIVILVYLGAVMVGVGALWGIISIPILSFPWLRAMAVGPRRRTIAMAYGLLTGVVSAWSTNALPLLKEMPLWFIASAILGAASSPFVAWAAGWDLEPAAAACS